MSSGAKGVRAAHRYFLTAERFTAEALRIGFFVHEVVTAALTPQWHYDHQCAA
jgi:hypothetical protein